MSFRKRRGTVQSYKPSLMKPPIPSLRRTDRRNDQVREMRFEYDIIPEASGSVFAQFGKSKVVAAIYGPKQSRNVSTFSNEGRFSCHFHFAPFAFAQRLTESR